MKISSVKNRLIGCVLFYFSVLFVNVSANNNVPDEISELFSYDNQNTGTGRAHGPVGLANNKIYAEGSSTTVNTSNHITNNITEQKLSEQGNKSNSIQSVKEKHNVTQSGNEVLPKPNQTTLDILTSIHEVAHGTSSIKPRKGVSYSKVVPKKGVNVEDFFNYSLPTNHSCFFLNKTNCYDVDYFSNLSCHCCNESNDLGKLISRQPLTNCTTCLPINKVIVEFCEGICCENITQTVNEKYDNSTTKKINKVFDNNKLLNVTLIQENIIKKKKPVVTNVPYDSDIKSPFNKSKGEKYIPIIVSIFILPLVGVLMFFVWKKTREIWDRRYYKRMDFLIDGMYNE